VVDLRDRAVRKSGGVSLADLECAWEDLVDRNTVPPTHTLAEKLMNLGVAGILVPSFAPGVPAQSCNFVAWRWSRKRPYRIQCIDDEGRLAAMAPRNPSD